MQDVLIATANQHKAKELQSVLPPGILKFLTLADFPSLIMPPEDGATLEANAVLKAVSAAKQSAKWTLADDTGLEVDALNGAPGVRSARYAGKERDYPANNAKLLSELAEIPEGKRTARFRCIAALASPSGRVFTAEGKLEGAIAFKARGEHGFGYDPIFLVQASKKTFAEMSFEEKNRISHRFAAIKNITPYLLKLAQGLL